MEEPTRHIQPRPPDVNPRALLFWKLLRAQQAAPPVPPSGVFAHGPLKGKSYVSYGDAMKILLPVLRAEGLVWTHSVLQSKDREFTTKDGLKVELMHTCQVQFDVTDVETGYTYTYLQEGRSLNNTAHGPTHALANAVRLGLQQLLQVPMAEPEDTPRKISARPTPSPAQPAPRPRDESSRIPEARGLHFRFSSTDQSWSRKDTGEALRTCALCRAAPMLPLRTKGDLTDWHCVSAACGNHERWTEVAAAQPAPVIEDPLAGSPAAAVHGPIPDAALLPPATPEEVGKLKAAADELEQLQRTLADFRKRTHLYDWQWSALVLADQSLPSKVEIWGAEDYLRVLDQLRKSPAEAIQRALRAMAKKEPVDPQRAEHLRTLVSKSQVPFPVRVEAEAASACGWHDAVEYAIETLEARTPQGELGVGGTAPYKSR
jgi:hypothetical protein